MSEPPKMIRARLVAMCQIHGCDALLLDESVVRHLYVRGPGSSRNAQISVCPDCYDRLTPKGATPSVAPSGGLDTEGEG